MQILRLSKWHKLGNLNKFTHFSLTIRFSLIAAYMESPFERNEADAVRRNILMHALEVIAEKGMHDTRIQDIAEHAGFSQGYVYRCFRSKEHMLVRLLELAGMGGGGYRAICSRVARHRMAAHCGIGARHGMPIGHCHAALEAADGIGGLSAGAKGLCANACAIAGKARAAVAPFVAGSAKGRLRHRRGPEDAGGHILLRTARGGA